MNDNIKQYQTIHDTYKSYSSVDCGNTVHRVSVKQQYHHQYSPVHHITEHQPSFAHHKTAHQPSPVHQLLPVHHITVQHDLLSVEPFQFPEVEHPPIHSR